MVDEENTLKVIHLVLNAGSEQPFSIKSMFLAVVVEEPDATSRRPLNLIEKLGNGKASFFVDGRFFGWIENFGIDEKERRGVFVLLGEVHDNHAQRHADLDGREADARRVVHRLQHVIHERAQFVIDPLDGF